MVLTMYSAYDSRPTAFIIVNMDSDDKTPQKQRVAVYIRVSTEEQAKEGFGLNTQLKHCKNAIAVRESTHGWVFDEKLVYRDEGFSGSLRHRPALDKMMQDIEKGKIDVVIVWRIDRLFRRMRFLLETVEKITEKGVMFQSASEPFDTTAVGQMVFQIFGVLAEFERNLIKIRTTEGKISASEEGNYVGGQEPFGYHIEEKYVDKKRASRKLKIYEEEAKWVRKMFVWFVERDESVETIAAKLTKLKVKSNADKKKTKKGISRRRKNPIGYWDPPSVRKKLKNETYAGKYYYNKQSKNEKGKYVTNPRSKWVEFECPAIIDPKLFEKAQKKFASPKRSNNAKNIYLLSGKVMCDLCGCAYTPYTGTKKTKNYRCMKNNKTKTYEKCPAKQISEKILGTAVWDYVEHLLQNPKKVFTEYQRELKKDSVYHALIEEREMAEKALEEAKQALARVKDAHRGGAYETVDEFKAQMAIPKEEIEKQKETLAEINAQLSTEEAKEQKIESVKALKEKYKDNFEKLTYEDKRKILQAVVDKVYIKGEDIKVVLRVPKAMQSELNKSKNLCGATSWN